jgi:hypothetical protein
MQKETSGRGRAESTVIKLIFEGWSGDVPHSLSCVGSYLGLGIAGWLPHNVTEGSPFRAALGRSRSSASWWVEGLKRVSCSRRRTPRRRTGGVKGGLAGESASAPLTPSNDGLCAPRATAVVVSCRSPVLLRLDEVTDRPHETGELARHGRGHLAGWLAVKRELRELPVQSLLRFPGDLRHRWRQRRQRLLQAHVQPRPVPRVPRHSPST